jgi:hypothetical protein
MAVNQVSKSARETGVSFTDYGEFLTSSNSLSLPKMLPSNFCSTFCILTISYNACIVFLNDMWASWGFVNKRGFMWASSWGFGGQVVSALAFHL